MAAYDAGATVIRPNHVEASPPPLFLVRAVRRTRVFPFLLFGSTLTLVVLLADL
jgi:hypothetical protein